MFLQAGFIDSEKPVVTVRPSDFEEAAKLACGTTIEEGKSKYTHVESDNLPYLCMDLIYQYTLLVNGFGKLILRSFFMKTRYPLGPFYFLILHVLILHPYTGLAPSQKMTLVKKVPYGNSLVEAAWPLGSAIDVMSSLA